MIVHMFPLFVNNFKNILIVIWNKLIKTLDILDITRFLYVSNNVCTPLQRGKENVF